MPRPDDMKAEDATVPGGQGRMCCAHQILTGAAEAVGTLPPSLFELR